VIPACAITVSVTDVSPLRRHWKIVAGCAAVAVVAVGLIVGLTREGSGTPTLVSEGPALTGTAAAPAVAGPELLTGERLTLAEFRGKPVFINVWASWCGPCREEAPDLKRFSQDRSDVVMIGLNMNDVRRSARTFNADAGWTYPSIFDPGGKVGVDLLKVANLPATYYVDAQGRLRGHTVGPVTYADLVSAADRI
jgi:cytochrome c biogenesis protein CcmG/thiol:disulfide interchange protein DsbE